MHYQWDSCRDEEPFVIFFMPVRSVQRLPVHYTGGLSQRRCTLFALSFCWAGRQKRETQKVHPVLLGECADQAQGGLPCCRVAHMVCRGKTPATNRSCLGKRPCPQASK